MFKKIKDSLLVLSGKKVAKYPEKKVMPSFERLPFSREERDFIQNTSMEFIFAEFGENRSNAGGAKLEGFSRLDPTLSSLRKYFPNALYTVYTDFDLHIPGVQTKRVTSPVKNTDNNPRFGHRSSVYFRFLGLLESDADFKCSIDTDMYATSEDIISLITLTEKFGFCVPHNVRQLLRQDMQLSLDTRDISDASRGLGYSYNQSPMTLWKKDPRGVKYFEYATSLMKDDPARGSFIMWKAAWETGIYPYVLPRQFCVCVGDQGCGDEVLLHLGHPQVELYYKELL